MIGRQASWLIFFPRPRIPRLRLFCVPYAGGGASVFRKWPETLANYGIEVCAVQLPGRESRISERPFNSLAEIVSALASELIDWCEVPFALFGHSLGALTCFELTRTLDGAGKQLPEHLFVSGARAPHLPRVEQELHLKSDNEFIYHVANRYHGLPQAVLADQELIKLLLPILRSDFTAYETYEYREGNPLGVSITAFGGSNDSLVCLAELEEWRQQTTRLFSLKLFHGDHFFLNTARVDVIASVLAELRLRV